MDTYYKEEKMSNKIILVHTGNYFPNYINDCIEQIFKYDFEIHLILSEKLHCNIKNKRVILSKAEEYQNKYYENFSIKRDNAFRDGFWNRTSNRFFLLAEYSKKNKIKNFFHIENDILIFDNLEKTRKYLEQTSFEMCIAVDAETRCVPSVVWFKEHHILQELSNFIFFNRNNDDMVNLKCFYDNNLNKVTNFPIIHVEKYNSKKIKYNNMFDKISCIFDGAAIGQFLGGIDSRNCPGDTVGFVNETTVFPVNKYKYIWHNKEPYIEHGEKRIKILNLHMHCKNLRKILEDK